MLVKCFGRTYKVQFKYTGFLALLGINYLKRKDEVIVSKMFWKNF